MVLRFLVLVLTVFFLAQTPQSGMAQGTEVSGEVSDILQQAADNGMSVIVLDGSGNMIGASEEAGESEAEAEAGDGSQLMKAQMRVKSFRETFAQRLSALPAAINEVEFILRASSPTGQIWAFFETVIWTLGFLAIGILFEREVYGKRFAVKFVVPRIKENPEGYSGKLPFLVYRFVAGCIGICVSVAVAILVSFLVFGSTDDTAIEFTYLTVTAAYMLVRVVSLVWRMILSPYLDQYRIPAFSTHDARKLHNWLFFVAMFDICTAFFGIWLKELGLNYDVFAIMSVGLNTALLLLNISMIFANRVAISNAIRNGRDLDDVTLATRLASQLWAPFMLVYMVIGWARLNFQLVLELPVSVPLIAGAYMILMSIIVVYATINYGIERYFQRARAIRELNEAAEELAAVAEEDGEDAEVQDEVAEIEEQLEELNSKKMNTFEDLARRISGILAMVAGLVACINIWNGENIMDSDDLSGRAIDVIVILFLGYIVFHAFRIWVDTKIREEQGDQPEEAELGDEGGASSASRLATLLPLFRNFILVVITVTIVLIALMELGVNVSPLFAGAGVVGLAIGFGAQTLVRDIFSGAFFLFDDAFRKGEYIDIGSVKGTVEKISVRSFQLRHHLGPLHTVPFGEITHLTNFSRDWVIMKLPLRVTYDTDVERVRKLIKKLGISLLDDPVIGKDFIQPLKSQGVIEMQDSAMIIRVKFMTKPGDQWMVRKRVFQEIRDLFEREGIKFAHREVTVRLADEPKEPLNEKQKEAIAGAVQGAIDDEALEGQSAPMDDR